MSITIQQSWDGADYQKQTAGTGDDSAEVTLLVSGSTTEADVLNAVMADSTYDYYPISGGTTGIPQEKVSIAERLSDDWWKVTVSYSVSAGGSGGTSEKPANSYTFDISAATAHVVRSLHTTKFPSSAPDPTAGIKDGEGTDIMVPQSRFSETRYFSDSKVTAAYKKTVAGLVGKTNAASFEGYDAGEVMFLGASGQRTGSDKWTVTFNFAVDFGETGLTIGTITGVSRGAWEMLWTRLNRSTSSEGVRPKAVAVYAEQVYASGDFTKLGL